MALFGMGGDRQQRQGERDARRRQAEQRRDMMRRQAMERQRMMQQRGGMQPPMGMQPPQNTYRPNPSQQSQGARVVQPGQQMAPRGGGRVVQPGQPAPNSMGTGRVVSPGNSGNTPAATGQLPPQAAPQAQQAGGRRWNTPEYGPDWGKTANAQRRPSGNSPFEAMVNPLAGASKAIGQVRDQLPGPFGNRPQRPEGVGRPQVDPQTRAQIGALRGGRPEGVGPKGIGEGKSYGTDRAAERRAQWGAAGPTQAEHDEWYKKTTDPTGYRAGKKLDEMGITSEAAASARAGRRSAGTLGHNMQTPDASSQWMSKEGMILQDGTRVPASELRDRGYVYKTARNDSGSVGGDNWTGNEVDRAAGWYATNRAKVPNPAYQEWESNQSMGGDNFAGGQYGTGTKPPPRYVTEAQEKKYKAARNNGDYDEWGMFIGGGR